MCSFFCSMQITKITSIKMIALSWAISVSLGALGAHFLKEHLTADALASFHVGLRYHFYFNIAALLLIVLNNQFVIYKFSRILLFMGIGTALFSGSIYLLSTSSLWGIDFKFLGPVTPIGGVLIIVSWILLFVNIGHSMSAEKSKNKC